MGSLLVLLLMMVVVLLAGKQLAKHWHRLGANQRSSRSDGRIRRVWTFTSTHGRKVLVRAVVALTAQEKVRHLLRGRRRCRSVDSRGGGRLHRKVHDQRRESGSG